MENICGVKDYLRKIKNCRDEDDLYDDKVGESVWEYAQDDNVSTRDIGEVLNLTLSSLETDEEIEVAEKILVAILGKGIYEIYNTVEERDKNKYSWYCESWGEHL